MKFKMLTLYINTLRNYLLISSIHQLVKNKNKAQYGHLILR